jgi:hypothetical protein
MEALAAIPGTWVYVEVKNRSDRRPETGSFVEVIESNGMSSRTVVYLGLP